MLDLTVNYEVFLMLVQNCHWILLFFCNRNLILKTLLLIEYET